MTLGQKLQLMRETKKLSREELAETLEVSIQSIHRWERDKCFPTPRHLEKIASYYNLTVEHLLHGFNSSA